MSAAQRWIAKEDVGIQDMIVACNAAARHFASMSHRSGSQRYAGRRLRALRLRIGRPRAKVGE